VRPATGADPRHLDHDGDTLTTSASPWLRNPNLPARNARICIVTQRDVAMVIERGRLHPRTLTATDQYLAGNKGQRFATSSAISSLAGAETIFAEKINPGHTVHDAPVLFDVPPGTTIASIELHDSVSSKGVKVALS